MFKDKAVSEYQKFRRQGIDVYDYFLSKYINLNGKNGISENLVISLFKNYLDKQNNVIWF